MTPSEVLRWAAEHHEGLADLLYRARWYSEVYDDREAIAIALAEAEEK